MRVITFIRKKILFSLLCAALVFSSFGIAYGDWASLGGENGGGTTAKTPRAAVETSLKWTKTFEKTAQWNSVGYPLLVGNFVYTVVGNRIYKINKDTAVTSASHQLGGSDTEAASSKLGIGYASFAAYGDGKIYVPLAGGDIQAFRADTLEPVWFASYRSFTQDKHKKLSVEIRTYKAGKMTSAKSAIENYIDARDGYPKAFAKLDGKDFIEESVEGDIVTKVRIKNIDYKAETRVLFKDGRVYTGVYYLNGEKSYGTFFALNAGDGSLAWEYEESGNLRGYYWAGVADAGASILVAGDAGKVVSLDAADGSLKAQISIASGKNSFARAGITYDKEGADAGTVYVSTKAGKIWRIPYSESTATFGTPRSAQLSIAGGASAPIVNGTKVYAFSGEINMGGRLDVFDKTTLAKKKTLDFGGYTQSFSVVSRSYAGKVYLYVMLNETGNDSVVVIEDGTSSAISLKYRTLYKPGGSQSLNSIIADSNGTLYFFDGSSTLRALSSKHLAYDPATVQGFKKSGGKTKYYVDGLALTGWQKLKYKNGKYYYFHFAADGTMHTGMQKIKQTDGKYYYYYFGASANDGRMKIGWQNIKKKGKTYRYYFGSKSNDGRMRTGWQNIKKNGKTYRYYFGAKSNDGKMRTGWQKIGGKHYYFGAKANDGRMRTGKQTIGGKKYIFAANGVRK